jgi:hypothetical protein
MKRFAALLLLSVVFLVYWPHVEYFGDDWILLPRFRAASFAELAASAAQNRIYEVFRTQWLSILLGFGITRLGGYSAQFNFAFVLLLHAVNAWLLDRALRRRGADQGLAFLAAALFLLLPLPRFSLFTYFTNPFYVFSAFWVLLMLAWPGPAWVLPLLAVAGMFAGEQPFLLLCTAVLAWRPISWRAAAATWAAMLAAAAVYLRWINQRPLEAGRYEWIWPTFANNVTRLLEAWWTLPGRLGWTLTGAALALVTFVVVHRAATVRERMFPRPLALLALAGLLLGYAPTLWLAGGFPLRYHYVPSPFVAVLLALACRLAGKRAAVAGGLLAGFFVLNADSEIRQCWIPAATHHRAFEAEVRRLRGVETGDFLIVIGPPFEIGTAQHFSLHSPETAGPFVESVTGARPVTVFLKWTKTDLRRTHLLIYSGGAFHQPEWVAQNAGHGRLRLLPLKHTPDPQGLAGALFTREQLALSGRRVYFP